MSSVTRMLREQRLRYAISRETDRQANALEPRIVDALVARAMQNIEAAFPDEETRMHASERAERSLQPVIAALVERPAEPMQDALEAERIVVFPWTSGAL